MLVRLIGIGLVGAVVSVATPAFALEPQQCLSASAMQAALRSENQVPVVVGNRVTTRPDRPVNMFTADGNGVGYELEGDAPQGQPSQQVCVVSRYHDVRINDITSPVVPTWALLGNDRAAAEADCQARHAGVCDSYDDYVRRATAGGMRVMLVARIDIASGNGTRRNGRLLTILARPGRNIADVTLTNSAGASESGGGLEAVNYTQFAGNFMRRD
jgi:hypothetical protein